MNMPSFVRALVAAIALFGLASTPALAVLKVEGRSAIFAWEPATGPVDHYAVHVARSGEKFKYRIEASMTAVNLGVAAPMSFFGFGGAKGSFFGDLKAHGREAFDFFTDKKIVISRWS